MPVVSIFSGSYCRDEEVAGGVGRELKCRLISDNEVVDWAANRFDFPREKLCQTMYGQLSVFSTFTREKERAVAYLREAIAELTGGDNVVHRGFAGHLLPGYVSHILKVCLVAGLDFRIGLAGETAGLAKGEARRRIRREDLVRSEWTKLLFQRGPWDKRLYDMKIPMHTTSIDEAVNLTCSSARSGIMETTPASRRAMTDFPLSARVNTALVEQGHDVEVTSHDGEVSVAISKYVLRLDHLREQFRKIGGQVAGVKSVQMREQPDFGRVSS